MLHLVAIASMVWSQCTPQNTETFKEWRTLTNLEKMNYLQAIVCLDNKPSQLKLDISVPIPQRLVPGGHPASNSRLDDFTYVRMRADGISWNLRDHAQYLPWHRVFLRLFDTALRKECHYRGPLPYWDLSLDYGKRAKPDILNYFGTDQMGRLPFPKLVDAKLDALTSSIPETHYVTRGSVQAAAGEYDPQKIKSMMKFRNTYDLVLSGLRRVHEYGLSILEGDIKQFATAPNDPIYFLLQRNADRLWYIWQHRNLPGVGFSYEAAKDKPPVSVYDKLQFFGLHDAVADVTVGQALNPKSNAIAIDGLMCFQY